MFFLKRNPHCGKLRYPGGSKRAEKESKKEKEKAKEKEKEKDKGKKGRVADEWGYEDPSRWEDKGPERASQGAKKWKDDEWDWAQAFPWWASFGPRVESNHPARHCPISSGKPAADADRRGERAGKDGGKGGAWSRSGRWDAERGYGGREEWNEDPSLPLMGTDLVGGK